MAETEFIKANAAEKDDVLVGAEIHDPAAVDAAQASRQQVLAAMTNVVKVTFFNYHNGARVIKWIFLHNFWSNGCSAAKYST